jgi:hypothetical protein
MSGESGLQREGSRWRRERIEGLQHLIDVARAGGRDGLLRLQNHCVVRQNELNGSDEGVRLLLATRHSAAHLRATAGMSALHRVFVVSGRCSGWCCFVFQWGLLMSGAHRPVAASHPVCVQGRSPNWRPQQKSCDEAHRCSELLSWSDRSVERRIHLVEAKNTAKTENSQTERNGIR